MKDTTKSPQYGIPEWEVKALKEQAAARAVRREEFLRDLYDPRRAPEGIGSVKLDPAIQRFMSMKQYADQKFKPSLRTALWGLAFLVPFPLFGYIVWNDRDKKERSYRTGQVAYKDRLFKLV